MLHEILSKHFREDKGKYIPWLPIPTQKEEYGTPYSHSGSALIVFWLKRVSQKTSAE